LASRMRLLILPAALVVVAALGLPSSADHGTRPDTRNLVAVGDSPEEGVVNSDMAFWGDMAFQGNFKGFRILDISDPTNPQEITDYRNCTDPGAGFFGGGQGDLVVWEDILVRTWDAGATASAICGTDPGTGTPTPIVRAGFEGLHVFDISDPTAPVLAASVDIDTDAPVKPAGVTDGCGSHTATGVPDLANNRLLIYSNSSSTAGTCEGFDIVDIPLSNPAGATWLRREDTGRSCHDLTVFLGSKHRAVCSGSQTTHGYAYLSMDAADGGSLLDPALLYQQTVPATTTIGHTSTFTLDGETLLWSHEPGGGTSAQCQLSQSVTNRQLFFFKAETGKFLGTWTIPPQTAEENCASVHIFQVIPTRNGRDIFVSGTYQAGTYVVDFTDPSDAEKIAWSDPPPLVPTNLVGGAWTTYWYNGQIYESDITKGLHVFESTLPVTDTPVTYDHLNPQTVFELPAAGTCAGQPSTISGTPGPDDLEGLAGPDVIMGFSGNDTITGLEGKDVVCAGPGDDQVRGGDGNDRLDGGAGNDTIRGQDDDDVMNGNAGRDLCVGGLGSDVARQCEERRSI
jgi:hemolysin type calcium-binding protein/LVIVD repeat-containing protein